MGFGMHIEFTTINHRIQKKFDLTLNEYAICNSIFYLQNTQEHYTRASSLYLGNFIGVNESTAKRILKKLESKDLIRKMKRTLTNHYCTTEIWNEEMIQSYPQSNTKQGKMPRRTGQNAPIKQGKMPRNNNSYKDNINTPFLNLNQESKLKRNKRSNGLINIKNILNNPDFAGLHNTNNG